MEAQRRARLSGGGAGLGENTRALNAFLQSFMDPDGDLKEKKTNLKGQKTTSTCVQSQTGSDGCVKHSRSRY